MRAVLCLLQNLFLINCGSGQHSYSNKSEICIGLWKNVMDLLCQEFAVGEGKCRQILLCMKMGQHRKPGEMLRI